MKNSNDLQFAENPKHTGRYPSAEAFAQAKLAEAIEATKNVDWVKVLNKKPKSQP
jgi:hypothetical protein